MKSKFIFLIFYSFIFHSGANAGHVRNYPLKLADSLYQVVRKEPDRFCELIARFSEDPASKERCGFYDFEEGDDFVEPIADVVRRAGDNSRILPPVKSIYGYHIIQPLGVRGSEISFRHLLILN